MTLVCLMAAVCIVMLIINPESYFTVKNLRSMLFQFPEYGIISLGMMLCMLLGGIDLSLVGIMNLSGLVASLILNRFAPANADIGGARVAFVMTAAILAAIAVGAICGATNGFIVSYFRLPAMLVTLCTFQLYKGIAYGITGGTAVNGMRSEFQSIANGTIGDTGIPWVLPIFLVVLALVAFMVKYTVTGQDIFFVGSNLQTAVYSGIDANKVITLTYTASGILGGISGILVTSHLNSAKVSNGSSYTLLSILIVVLGGVRPKGGSGKIVGVTLSILLMQMISNAFTIMHVSQEAKNFANGALLIIALLATQIIQRVSEKRKENAASANGDADN